MKYISIISLIFSTLILTNTSYADSQNISLSSKILASTTSWANQSGFVASISFSPSASQPATYIVSGHYVNNAAGYGCQGTPYPLSGFYYANTQTISFSVAWSNSSENCQSVTGWTGYLESGASALKMKTDWNIAFSSASGPKISQGNDVFTLNSVLKSKLLNTQ